MKGALHRWAALASTTHPLHRAATPATRRSRAPRAPPPTATASGLVASRWAGPGSARGVAARAGRSGGDGLFLMSEVPLGTCRAMSGGGGSPFDVKDHAMFYTPKAMEYVELTKKQLSR